MDTIYKDYILYYEARMKRREHDAVYTNSYLSEKAMYELVASCNSIEDLQSKAEWFKELTIQNAIALVRDQETYRKAKYEACKESIRLQSPSTILQQLDNIHSDSELIDMVNKVHQQNNIDVTIDQLMNIFYNDFVSLENIEVYQQAEVPEEWKVKIAEYKKDIFAVGKKLWQETELPAARQWKQDWTMNYELLKQERHRRLIPVNDEELNKKIALHKTYKTV